MKFNSKSSNVSRKRPLYISDARVRDCVSRFIYICLLLIKLCAQLWSLQHLLLLGNCGLLQPLVDIKYTIEPEECLQASIIDSWVFYACSSEVEN